MQATITSKGQITIPSGIRKHLRLRAGDVLEFDETAPFLKATRAVDLKRMRSTLGRCKEALAEYTTDQWLAETRGAVALPRKAKQHDHRG